MSPELKPILGPNRLRFHGRFHIPRYVWERMPKTIPATPADNVPCELSFNEADGVVLKLHGQFSRWGPPSVPGSGKAIPTIFGSDGYRLCVLYVKMQHVVAGMVGRRLMYRELVAGKRGLANCT